jgi:hypothetical protein
VNSTGVPQWKIFGADSLNGVALCTAGGDQYSGGAAQGLVCPAIAPDDAGGAMVAWLDDRDVNPGIYAKRTQPPPAAAPTDVTIVHWGDTFIQAVVTSNDDTDFAPAGWAAYTSGASASAIGTPQQLMEADFDPPLTACTYYDVHVRVLGDHGLLGAPGITVSGQTCCTLCDMERPPARRAGAQSARQHDLLALGAPRPNPARGTAEIRWSIPPERAGERFQIAAFDVSGRKVATVAEGKAQAGSFSATLRSEGAAPLPEGVYFLCLQIGRNRLTRSLIVQR